AQRHAEGAGRRPRRVRRGQPEIGPGSRLETQRRSVGGTSAGKRYSGAKCAAPFVVRQARHERHDSERTLRSFRACRRMNGPMIDQQTPTHASDAPVDENHLIAERRAKLAALRAQGIAFPNDFRRVDHAGDLQSDYADAARWTGEALEGEGRRIALAGRLLAKRV